MSTLTQELTPAESTGRAPAVPGEIIAAYIEESGAFCLYCQSDRLRRNPPESYSKGTVTRHVQCAACRRHWFELLRLSDVAVVCSVG